MRTIIIILCGIQILSWRMLLNSFFYAFWRKGCYFVNRNITNHCARLAFALFKTYANMEFIGERNLKTELPEQYLIISNHQSLLDIVALMRWLRGGDLRFVAKQELAKYVPLVSVMLKSDGHCLVKRSGSPSSAMKVLDTFAEKIKNSKLIPVIFPEGTRSKDGNLGTFHSAGFRRFLNNTPLPVAVCALDGGYKISSLRKIVKSLNGGAYRLKILKIYPAPQNKEEQVKILEEGKALIQEQLNRWRRK